MIVVSAGIVSRDGKIMLCQRRPGDRLSLKWEFPGGKMEEGETLQQTLERELMEEIGAVAHAGDAVYVCQSGPFMIVFLETRLEEGALQCIEVQDARFVTPEEARALNMTPQDRAAMEHMLAAGKLI